MKTSVEYFEEITGLMKKIKELEAENKALRAVCTMSNVNLKRFDEHMEKRNEKNN